MGYTSWIIGYNIYCDRLSLLKLSPGLIGQSGVSVYGSLRGHVGVCVFAGMELQNSGRQLLNVIHHIRAINDATPPNKTQHLECPEGTRI